MTSTVAERALRAKLATVEAVAEAAEEVIGRYFGPDCCILASRVGLEALNALGISDGYPQSVAVVVVNAEAARLLGAGMSQEQLHAVMTGGDLTAETPGGPWVLGVDPDMPARNGRFPGHVVVVVPLLSTPAKVGLLLDLTQGQLSRPHKGIRLEAYLGGLTPEWFEPNGMAAFELEGGCFARYRPVPDRPGDESFRNSPDWTWPTAGGRRALYRRVTGEVVRLARQRLAGARRAS